MPYSVDRYRSNSFFGQPGWPLTVNDGNIIANATSLKLLGRGVPNYGEFIAENFIHLLENFSGLQPPDNPISGQLWYDTDPQNPGTGTLKIFNGVNFSPVSNASNSSDYDTSELDASGFPNVKAQGQMHLNNGRIYIFNGTNWRPIFSYSQGISLPTNPELGDMFFNTQDNDLKIRVGAGTPYWLDVMITDPNDQFRGQNSNFGVAEGYFLFKSIKNNISATGFNISGATILNNNINVITSIPSINDNGVKFNMNTPVGAEITVMNKTSSVLKVYPQDGGVIDELLPNQAYDLGPQAKAVYIKISSTEYVTMTAIYG